MSEWVRELSETVRKRVALGPPSHSSDNVTGLKSSLFTFDAKVYPPNTIKFSYIFSLALCSAT